MQHTFLLEKQVIAIETKEQQNNYEEFVKKLEEKIRTKNLLQHLLCFYFFLIFTDSTK
jgi:cytoskeletal protein RodZ